jgi:hypothetical protein
MKRQAELSFKPTPKKFNGFFCLHFARPIFSPRSLLAPDVLASLFDTNASSTVRPEGLVNHLKRQGITL